eukprot:gene12963-biopygen6621
MPHLHPSTNVDTLTCYSTCMAARVDTIVVALPSTRKQSLGSMLDTLPDASWTASPKADTCTLLHTACWTPSGSGPGHSALAPAHCLHHSLLDTPSTTYYSLLDCTQSSPDTYTLLHSNLDTIQHTSCTTPGSLGTYTLTAA